MGLCIVASLVMALAAVAWFKFCPKPGADEALTFPVDAEYTHWVGKPADLDFVSLDGRRVSSAELKGKVVLINFWATWSEACMQSLEQQKETYTKFREQGLEVVAINFDENRAALESVIKSNSIPWPQSFAGRENLIGKKFGISHYPSAWLVDKAGNVRFVSALKDTDKKISTLLLETDAQAIEIGKNANSGYRGRMNQGFATMSKMKVGAMFDALVVRARTMGRSQTSNTKSTNTDGSISVAEKVELPSAPAPASLTGLGDSLKIRSVMLGAKPSVVIQHATSTGRYLGIGETLRVQTPQGDVILRCDRIETKGVLLTEVSSGAQLQLKLR